MAMLLGAARLLKEAEAAGTLAAGCVRLVFQPAEEAEGGGKVIGWGQMGRSRGGGDACSSSLRPPGVPTSRGGRGGRQGESRGGMEWYVPPPRPCVYVSFPTLGHFALPAPPLPSALALPPPY